MRAYVQFVLRFRGPLTVLCLTLTLLTGWKITQASIASSVGKMFLGESPAYRQYLSHASEFGNDEILVVGWETENPLDPDHLNRLQRAAAAIEAIDEVERVHSLADAQRIVDRDGSLVVEPYVSAVRSNPEAVDRIRDDLLADELVRGTLLASDARATAIVVELAPNPERAAEEGPRIVERVLQILEGEGFRDLHRAGLLATTSEVMAQTRYSIGTLLPITAVVLLLAVWLLFRRLWPALVSLAIAGVGVTWTMGFAVMLDREVNVMMAMVPAVVLIVSFSDVVHLISAYLLELDRGLDRDAAIIAAGSEVGRACAWTSATTFVGFVSLSLVPTPVFRSMGIILGFGVGVALLLAVTLVPMLFSVMPRPRPLRGGATGRTHDLLERGLLSFEQIALNHPWPVIAGFGLFTVVAIVGCTRIEIETRFEDRLRPTNPVQLDLDWFSDRFAGSTLLDVTVEGDGPDSLLDPTALKALASLQEQLAELPTVDDAYSVVDILVRIHEVMGDGQGELPDTRPLIAQYLLLFELGGGEDLEQFIDFERRQARIVLRLNDSGFRSAATLGRSAEQLAREALPSSMTGRPVGLSYLLGDWLDEILEGQRRGVLASLIVITIMMAVAMGSVRVGLWSMIPNVLPLLTLGGYVGFFWETTDSDTLLLALLSLGIGVDDTIHFLTRFRIEAARQPDAATAVRQTLHYAGRAIVMTTVILVGGFLPFSLSDYFSTRIMGTLLPVCLVVALLADALLVPALAQVGLFRFRPAPAR